MLSTPTAAGEVCLGFGVRVRRVSEFYHPQRPHAAPQTIQSRGAQPPWKVRLAQLPQLKES